MCQPPVLADCSLSSHAVEGGLEKSSAVQMQVPLHNQMDVGALLESLSELRLSVTPVPRLCVIKQHTGKQGSGVTVVLVQAQVKTWTSVVTRM